MSEAALVVAGGARAPAGRLSAIHLLLVLSGFAGLGYQIVWTRMLSIGLGHEVFAMLAVVSAFFAGLALGALALDRRIAQSRRPGLWYAALEATIGLWTLGLIWLIPAANGVLADWIGQDPSELRRWGLAFLGPLLLLAPATLAMGATMPAAERLYARLRRDGGGIGGLYGANAAGAMAGALATAFWLAPALGFSATLACFAALNLLCAGAALLGPARDEAARPALPAAAAGAGPHRGALATLFLTGLIGVGYEVAVVRALSQLLENTVYSFAAALAVYLAGTALGAGAYQRLYAPHRGSGVDAPAFAALIAVTASACALGVLGVFAAPAVNAGARALLGASVPASIAAELAAATVVFGPASAAMAALFSHLAEAARGPEGGLGAAFAANTTGAALAPLAIGVLAIPALGVIATLTALSLAYLALLIGCSRSLLARQARRLAPLLALAPALAALAFLGPFDRRLITPPEGGRVRAHLEGVAATASVVEDAARHRHLRVNGLFTMGGTASYALDRIQGHAALLQHPHPTRALYLGVGTGATLASAAAYPQLEAEGVELLPEVLALLPEFPEVTRDLEAAADRISLHVADARRYVRASRERYDVILADNFHPAKDGAGLLYTREHFQAIRSRLSEDGIFVQWLPLHQLDIPTLKLITRTYLSVFPDARLFMGNTNLATPLLALYGARSGAPPKLSDVTQRRMQARLLRELDAIGLDTPFALFGGFMAGPEELSRFAGPGPLNTDDHPRVMFEAPRTVYAPLGPPIDRLLSLVDRFEPKAAQAADLSDRADAAAFGDRLEAYWRARDAFLALGAQAHVAGVVDHDAAVLAPKLIEIIRMSPDFAPAYLPVVRMARALAQTDRPRALLLLQALEAANPTRSEARRLRLRLRLQSAQ